MIGLDTNVVVRYIVQDDPRQTTAATELIEGGLTPRQPGFVPLVVLCELVWVLESCYDAARAEVAQAVRVLLTAKQIVVEQPAIAWKALRAYEAGGTDFADGVIVETSRAAGCEKLVTFDRRAAKLPGAELLA
jgi:predicted nucleic-acid-binding protein